MKAMARKPVSSRAMLLRAYTLSSVVKSTASKSFWRTMAVYLGIVSSCGILNLNIRWTGSKYVWFAWSLYILAAESISSTSASPIMPSLVDFMNLENKRGWENYASHLAVECSGHRDLDNIHILCISFRSLVVDRLDNIDDFADRIGPRWTSPFLLWVSVLASIWIANFGTAISSRKRLRNLSEMRGMCLWSYRDPSLLPAFPLLAGVLSND